MKEFNHRVRLGKWYPAKASLEEHMEAGSLRIQNKLYVIGGYQTLTRMCMRMQIFDMETNKWSYGPELPEGFPLSHAGIASDERYLFIVSGQPGPACEPATDKAWAMNLNKMTWESIASLPGARYSPLLEYVDGNLHLISGAIEDRETISNDHFILQIRDKNTGVAASLPPLEKQIWRKGPPIPKGGDHAASVVLDGKIYVIGGEHGHAPLTMDAAKCCGTYWGHNYLFRYDPGKEHWERLADMPFASSHIESQTIVINNRIVVLGGSGDHDIFTDRTQEYDPARNSWREMERLPIPRKGGVVWQKNGVVYFNGGQTMQHDANRYVVAETIAAKIKSGFWRDMFGY